MQIKIMLIIVMTLMMVITVSASQGSLGTFKQNSCINLLQTCANCSYNKITSVILPNGNKDLGEVTMTANGTEYNYSYCNTNQIGIYTVNGKGDPDGVQDIWIYNFTISPTGYSNNLIFFYIVMFMIPWGLFILGLWKKDMTFAVLGTIGFYFIALYLITFGINGNRDWLSNGLGVIHLGVAFYTSIRYTLESIDLNW